MDAAQFDTLARSLTASRSRRRALAAVVGGALGVAGLAETEAKKKKPCPPCKKRKKGTCKKTLPDGTACTGGTCQNGNCVATELPPLVFTAFGCVAVGQACRGDGTYCCSGRCLGAALVPGQPDTSRCVAHDTGTCPPGAPTCPLVTGCTTPTGFVGTCLPTTGGAAYCASAQTCAICTRDSDCIPIAGATAACIAACDARCSDTGGRLCVGNLVD